VGKSTAETPFNGAACPQESHLFQADSLHPATAKAFRGLAGISAFDMIILAGARPTGRTAEFRAAPP
jgi:hypothetical protein